jgi:hypothetical protein
VDDAHAATDPNKRRPGPVGRLVSRCAAASEKLQLTAVAKRRGKTVAGLGGATLALAVGLGIGGAGAPPSSAMSPPSSAVPAPPSGNDGGAIRVRPAGGGACIIGLNCGCIPHHTCPSPPPRPGTAGANQHKAPDPPKP